ncbi:low molecular weight protein-tyrosine-phosphatase [Cerasicoccus arenae]|uniref:Phosphotyrosine protein phosphatase n=1 Tax=Cerasicoccus arenae TaxID=424488 RepID=A0A8J3DFF9_9BACT|nr:low molecular weight protein-tyrosine-phosphatase [Cerasicoccus arenae]MBK1859509.1 low molecular weight phosphotyrosine protein phosphatase [Cerasicoccus arenae]GHB95053.1 phosphotyrosine protein phosphatase [Cerasicoccus arenae]
MKSILFLCMGNICRSPAAHCVFQFLVDEAGLSEAFHIDSAGTIGYNEGSPPDHRMQAAMRQRDIPVIGHSRPLTSRDLKEFDLVLAMDRANLADARLLATNDQQLEKIQLFANFCTNHNLTEVPDPYYGGRHGFDHVMDIVEDGCAGLLKNLQPNA